MAELFDSNAPLFAVGFGIVAFLLILLVFIRFIRRTREALDHQRLTARHAEKELIKANNQLQELRSVVIGLGQKMTDQQELVQHLTERVTELEHVDSDSRLYSRASKMVQLGAGVDELIEECELPKAEAELMMALQNKIAGKEKVPPMRMGQKRK